MLIDTHSHLNFDNYDDDRDAVIARAGEQGVETMVCIGMLPAGGREALALARSRTASLITPARLCFNWALL